MDYKTKKPWLSAWFVVLIAAALQSACTVTPPSSAMPPALSPVSPSHSIAPIVKTIEPALVRLSVAGGAFTNWGSGFIVDARGYIVTNQHLAGEGLQANVTLMNGDTYIAKVVMSAAKRDIAVLKISSNRTDFTAAVLGTSASSMVGDDVIGAGFPLGSVLPGPATFSRGIISAFRTMNGVNYIQTDVVTINIGSSGAPLVNMEGKVIGITVGGVLPPNIDAEGIGLVIPIDEVKSFILDAIGK